MILSELDQYFHGLLPIDELAATDSSLNGLQVGRTSKDITRIAFAVDACMETYKRAAEWEAEMLFVHHGMFWGPAFALTGYQYTRIHYLTEHDLALYAVHLPLDVHPEFGNNAGITHLLEISEVEPFGAYKGQKIGFKGTFDTPLEIDGVLQRLGLLRQDCLGILPFGPQQIRSVGIVSGGATREVDQALQEGLDLYITGEISHQVYHQCLEGGINLIAGGHYQTEIWGVKMVAEKTKEDTGIECRFIDVPTGL